LERELERRFRVAVQSVGGIAYKFTSPGRAGVPDRMIVLPGGVTFFVELKSATGRLTPLQFREHDRLRTLGCYVFVVRAIEDYAFAF
jgi:hypothetical protein